MSPRDYWRSYVNDNGGMAPVADRLGLPYSTIAAVTSGHRGIGHKLAGRMVKADPSLDVTILIWVRPLKSMQGSLDQADQASGKRAA